MNTELKKQLIDAGYIGVNGHMDFLLEELIEACGHGYFTLVHTIDHWAAHMGLEENVPWYEGSTPTEAVARLWLALNKK